jgi:folylpolyglutamate synthase/dihydropteroate synthase
VDPEELDEFLRREYPSLRTIVATDAAAALKAARASTPEGGLVLTTGSLWLAGEMRALLKNPYPSLA